METPKAAFRLDKETLKLADRLVKNPTKGLLDPVKGAPRNRTELIERLIANEAKQMEEK